MEIGKVVMFAGKSVIIYPHMKQGKDPHIPANYGGIIPIISVGEGGAKSHKK